MSTIPWEQVREVVDAVLDLPPEERTPYLDQACPVASVRRYVESLVVCFEHANNFMDEPAIAYYPEAVNHEDIGSWTGRRVGAYQVVEEIGQGGMGSVYRALRADDQYRKEVAIKIIRSGFDTRLALDRFLAERQILADLDDPNIARLLEGGTTDNGEPYFVMEYIEGEPLDRYCDNHKLSVTDRLQLFLTVCSAVQYAHQKLVIHRDIKPGNIMVSKDGVPKLLDFGIAKILGPESGVGAAVQTMPQARLLTPAYASPEQLRGEAVTTASDVYSLGVVLYELLTGHRPYRASSRQPEDMMQMVAASDPERPSAAIYRASPSTEEEAEGLTLSPETVSATREGSLEKLRRRLCGDLDNIVLMALRREPQRRYTSVEQLSEDIRRHLEGLPVVAHKDSFAYRSGKFVRRHTAAMVTAILVVVSLTVGLVVSLRQAKIARAERSRAESRFNDVRSLARSLMFDIYDGIRDLPGSTQTRQLVVANALKYLDSLAGEARGDASLQHELADAYERVGAVQGEPYSASLGDTAGALQSYLKAHSIRKATAATDAAADRIKYSANCRMVAVLQQFSSDSASAINSAQEAVAITQALLEKDPTNQEALAELASDYSNLGLILDESHSGSGAGEQAHEKALEISQKLVQNSTDRARLRSVAADEYHIGRHLRDAGYRKEALDAFNQSLIIFDRLAQDSNNTKAQRDVATVRVNAGDTFLMNGDAAHALVNYQKGLTMMTAISAADPSNGDARAAVGEANLNIGISLVKLGKASGAMQHLLLAIAIFEKGVASDPKWEGGSWDLVQAYVWTASVTPQPNQSREYYQKALAIDQRLEKVDTGTSDWLENEAEVRVQMGNFFFKIGQLEGASENYGRAVALAEPVVGSQPDRQEAHYALAGAYLGLGQVAARKAHKSLQSDDKTLANWNEAKSWYQRSADAWRQIRHPAAVSPNGFDSGDAKEATLQLARCNAALARLIKQPQP